MLDVAIGLALVLAILSLLGTAVQEAVASIFNRRGKNLERLVSSLVGDDLKLAQKILAHPFLTSMALEKRDQSQRLPSYLDSDVFVTGLLGFLNKEYGNGERPATPQQFVLKLRTQMGRNAFVDSLESLYVGVESDWPSFEQRLKAWYEAVGTRSSGWYKRENQVFLFVIGFIMAALLNINPIVICKALWSDAALRKSTASFSEQALQVFFAGGSNPRPLVTSPPAESSFKIFTIASVDRYLTQLQVQMEGLPKPSVADFKSGSAHEVAALVQDVGTLRSLLVHDRSIVVDEKNQKLRDVSGAKFDLILENISRAADLSGADDGKCSEDRVLSTVFCGRKDVLRRLVQGAADGVQLERSVRAMRAGDLGAKAKLQDMCKGAGVAELSAVCLQLNDEGILGDSKLPMGWSVDAWPHVFPMCPHRGEFARHCEEEKRNAGPSTDINGLLNWGVALAGWFITAVGITLGAPFWFDVLSKAVKVRGSGAKADDKSAVDSGKAGAGTSSSTLTSAGTGDIKQTAASDDAQNDAERRLTEQEIGAIQRALEMDATKQSGRLDLRTRERIAAWQEKNGAAVTGNLTDTQIQSLLRNPIPAEEDGYVG